MATSRPPSRSLVEANQQQSAQLRRTLLGSLAGLWMQLGSWRETDVARFVRTAVPLVQGAQRRMSAQTAAYLSRQIAQATGQPLRHTPAPRIGDIRGVPMAEEYARPFHDVWTALHDGNTLPEAVQQGQHRLQNLAATDVQLAKTHASRQVLASHDRVVGYRRVLEGAHSCGLCVVASTQRYHKGDLMPIHPGCDCSVVPIIDGHDPGRTIDEQRLAHAHQAIADRFGSQAYGARGNAKVPDYRKVLVTHHHGEIGPVLAVRGETFTGPSDLHH